MKIILVLSMILTICQAGCLLINQCDDENQDYSQFVAFSMMKCYYEENNHYIGKNIEELDDEDWLIFTMFLNQYNLLCNYYKIINNINGITQQIQEVNKLQEFANEALNDLKVGFNQIDLISINFTKALSVCQITLKNQEERLKKYSNISLTLQYIENATKTQQQEQNNNLNNLLSFAMSMNLVFDNCSQEMIRFYAICGFALLLIFQFSLKNKKYWLSIIIIAASEFFLNEYINFKLIRYHRFFKKILWFYIDIIAHNLQIDQRQPMQQNKLYKQNNKNDQLQIKNIMKIDITNSKISKNDMQKWNKSIYKFKLKV